MNHNVDTDVLVIGSGLAGLTLEIAARRYGLDVFLADVSAPSADHWSAESLTPDCC
jgi:succinate dehydrogenase/fumarate reductase flavoprotein subunit